ncbi:MAG: hypothetical protein ACE3L7_02315 [Candidatus Pristimantibacillus sp.]
MKLFELLWNDLFKRIIIGFGLLTGVVVAITSLAKFLDGLQ